VFDPSGQLSRVPLQVYQLQGMFYVVMETTWLEHVGLGVALWEGTFEAKTDVWLRWCDQNGQVIPTGAEMARQAQYRAEEAQQYADQESQRAEQAALLLQQERLRSERLIAKLQALGVDPDSLL
jgi:hypothetical protein